MRVGFAQIDTTVGDFEGNSRRILEAYRELEEAGADVVLTPELALVGYPPRDLLFKSRFVPGNLEALDRLESELGHAALVVGFVEKNETGQGRPFFNAAAVLRKRSERVVVRKQLLPMYDVFDETRYFEAGPPSHPLEISGKRVGITICEDIWTADYLARPFYTADPVDQLVRKGAKAILNLSASPFELGKPAQRLEMIRSQARRSGVPFYYCNAVGGNDQLVFDGNSLAISADGKKCHALASFREEVTVVQPEGNDQPGAEVADLHDALVLGVRDYMGKCGFRSCVIGLSGGIDSAVTAAIATAAVGAENVLGVGLPGPHSSRGSIDDARALAGNLGISFELISIKNPYDTVVEELRPLFEGRAADTIEENIQARLRGVTLMALSNKLGSILLTTGNKSELAVGYCTIYGDMAGGLAVISDVPKTRVYELARYINRNRELIPDNTIEKPPSAELRPDQKDEDSLPPYALLDEILRLYIEENLNGVDIIARGYDEEMVRWIVRRVDLNEYKRQQAPPGIKVTGRAFGMGRRIPIAQRFVA